MKEVEKTGKTVEEAIEKALKELNAKRSDVEVEIAEEPSKGFLGIIGGKPARVKVNLKDQPEQRAERFINKILEAMKLKPLNLKVIEEGDKITFELKGEHLGILIGRRGETLDALQYLVNLSVNKNQENRKRILIDVEGYRNKREKALQRLALRLAERARGGGKSVVLEPMNSHERKVIHMVLQGRDDIYTFSEGEDPYRRVVISPKRW